MINRMFQIFGSKSSEDYDVMVFIKKIPNIEESKKLCHKYDKELYMFFIDKGMPIKKVNCNLAMIRNGHVYKVHKGTSDEVNNSLYLTYKLHKQFFPLQINSMVGRDVDMKVMRCARNVLMMFSRTEHRFDVKRALKSNFIEKINVLNNLDISTIKDLGTKNVNWEDYIKGIAFQLGQTIALMQSNELYTKEDIGNEFPELKSFLNRNDKNLTVLNKYKNIFIDLSKKRIPFMKTYNEYKK